MRLLDLLFPPRADERILRDVSPETFCALATPYTVAATRPATIGLTLYTDPLVRAAIHEAKYHGSKHAFTLLASLLADFLPAHLADSLDVEYPISHIIVPVPLGRERRRERGYNQVEEVARRALRMLGDPSLRLDTSLLLRIRETPTQVSLARRAREENMRGAFGATGPVNPRAHYLILDDVLTTGATLGGAVDALVAAGVSRENILPLALTYQP